MRNRQPKAAVLELRLERRELEGSDLLEIGGSGCDPKKRCDRITQ